MASSAEIKSGMRAVVSERSSALHQQSFEGLKTLPEVETEEIEILGTPVRLITYRENQNSNHLFIVVQAIRETLLGMSAQICVEGFVVSSSGEKAPATDETLWDYQ